MPRKRNLVAEVHSSIVARLDELRATEGWTIYTLWKAARKLQPKLGKATVYGFIQQRRPIELRSCEAINAVLGLPAILPRSALTDWMRVENVTSYRLWRVANRNRPGLTATAIREFLRGKRDLDIQTAVAVKMAMKSPEIRRRRVSRPLGAQLELFQD